MNKNITQSTFSQAWRTLLWIVGIDVVGIILITVACTQGAPIELLLLALLIGACAAIGGITYLLLAYFDVSSGHKVGSKTKSVDSESKE